MWGGGEGGRGKGKEKWQDISRKLKNVPVGTRKLLKNDFRMIISSPASGSPQPWDLERRMSRDCYGPLWPGLVGKYVSMSLTSKDMWTWCRQDGLPRRLGKACGECAGLSRAVQPEREAAWLPLN